MKLVHSLAVQKINLILISLTLTFSAAQACPEVSIPVNPRDSALEAHAWKRAFKDFRAKRYMAAYKKFTRTAQALQAKAERLFQPQTKKTPSNAKIQRWLQRHVYNKKPGVLIRSDRFTFPVLVWWAWADSACRVGQLKVAERNLREVRRIQPLPALLYHEAVLGLRLGRLDAARKMLLQAPPDSFVTPFVQGMIAKHEGRLEKARERLKLAKGGAALDDQEKVVDQALRGLGE
ncbi:MAG TPA: hypothetical protein EYN06_00610 [Myxococcales bacterium]|nr:hypothetical protein [Myxococcales bacterium]HIN84949.1 hypothetical protein [Myxococcales bacterium]